MDRTAQTATPEGTEPTPSVDLMELGDAKALTKGWQDLDLQEANPLRPTRPPI